MYVESSHSNGKLLNGIVFLRDALSDPACDTLYSFMSGRKTSWEL